MRGDWKSRNFEGHARGLGWFALPGWGVLISIPKASGLPIGDARRQGGEYDRSMIVTAGPPPPLPIVDLFLPTTGLLVVQIIDSID